MRRGDEEYDALCGVVAGASRDGGSPADHDLGATVVRSKFIGAARKTGRHVRYEVSPGGPKLGSVNAIARRKEQRASDVAEEAGRRAVCAGQNVFDDARSCLSSVAPPDLDAVGAVVV